MSQKVLIPSDAQYETLQDFVSRRISSCGLPVFRTRSDEEALWNLYLGTLPEDIRQHYNCSACRHFIKRYGGLVIIHPEGMTESLIWGGYEAPAPFDEARRRLQQYVESRPVVGVYLWSTPVWGTPETGDWTHLAGRASRVSNIGRLMTPGQAMADKQQDFIILQQGLKDYPLAALEQAVRVLESDAVGRSEKAEGIARWFLDLAQRVEAGPKALRRNLIWQAVATAPPGYCHVRSTMISTLLDDIVAGKDFTQIKRAWEKKMHPLAYQRPRAAPREQQIREAEKRVEELGIALSLKRRYATLDDVQLYLWRPRQGESKPITGGVFDHLRESQINQLSLPAVKVTWEKFARAILPDAEDMEILAPSIGSYYGLVTAVDPEAPPIIQWDGMEGFPRNPVSWYFHAHRSSAAQWGLRAQSWYPVAGIFPSPHRWQRPDLFDHQGDHIFFAIKEATESNVGGLALFPEILRQELRAVRSVIEAHSNRMELEGRDAANANGLAFQRNGSAELRVRVKQGAGVADFIIDRWD